MKKKTLLRIEGLSADIGLPVRLIRTLMEQRKITYLSVGRRTVLFDPIVVRAELDRFRVDAVRPYSQAKSNGKDRAIV